MLISPTMELEPLILLMDQRTTLGQGTSIPNLDEAKALRDLLVRDYPGLDTSEIADGTWHLYCCAVEPNENDINAGLHDPLLPSELIRRVAGSGMAISLKQIIQAQG